MGVYRLVKLRLLARFHTTTFALFVIDMICIAIADLISFHIFEQAMQNNSLTYQELLRLTVFVYGIVFVISGFYRRIWKYATDIDFMMAAGTILLAGVLTTITLWFMESFKNIYMIPIMSTILVMLFVGGIRLFIRLQSTIAYRSAQMFHSRVSSSVESVLIYGAGSAGALLSREILLGKQKKSKIIGFIDDDPRKKNLQICGRPILGNKSNLPRILVERHVDKIIICIPSLARTELRGLVDELSQYRLPIYILPPLDVLSLTDLLSQVRKVKVDDLLGRERMSVDVSIVGDYIRDKVILITGGGGSIGKEISRQIADLVPRKLILLGRGENSIFEIQQELRVRNPDVSIEYVIADIREYHDMFLVFQKYKPDTVFHTAAHKHVPLMEANPGAAFVNNVIGTKSLILLAQQFEVERFVFISTDKAVYPTNVMGSSKRIVEMYLQSLANSGCNTKIVIVRFGNVLGSRNSVVQIFNQQIASGGPVRVTDERMTRYFMTIPEATRLVIESGAIGMNGHVYLLKMGEPVRIIDLAERMIRLSGLKPGIDMKIEIMGKRPGEKLYEELMSKVENIVESGREGIMRVVGPTIAMEELNRYLAEMWNLYSKNRQKELGEFMKSVAWWSPKQQGKTEEQNLNAELASLSSFKS
jgi:FlaA1/EpsC-like NDP-sugar epimerase